MAKKKTKRVVTVHKHPRHVPVSPKNPDIAIPMSIRWLFRKRATAMNQLKRVPDHEELILEYKGLLKSNSEYKTNALNKYRDAYAKLKK